MFLSAYRPKSKLMVHAQRTFCNGYWAGAGDSNWNNTGIHYGDAFEYAFENGVDLQFLEDNDIFGACEDPDDYVSPDLFEIEIYR